ncbi:MAG TPA: TonB-dependent receptor [Candidatus Acidoferrales bacterium]|jgi:hypothetical protein|nr:TonB-dependent receptor [Candidatus Acidoferrales bacterium]
MRSLILVSIAVSMVCVSSVAQETRATLTGTVADAQGGVIPGANVVARNTGTNSEAKASTNESGQYVLPFLGTGVYVVTATSAGFKSAVNDNVTLGVGQRMQLDFKMEIGGMTESVTVSAQAQLLNTANASRGTTITTQEVADLPLLGKNPYTFAYHAAGVLHINPQGSITDRPFDNGGMDYLSIAGGRPFTNEFLLDGAPNTNTERGNVGSLSFVPPPEATEEVGVLNNNYDAQFGRTGGGVVQATLKSGTNKLHGTLYEYHRNKVLNANTWNANRAGQPRGPFIWNQPGVTVNGPVYIPRVYNGRNKTFFLFSWEAIKQNIPNITLDTVPSVANRAGDFSSLHQTNGSPIVIYDPLSTGQGGGANIRLPFAGNQIPQSRFDPVALKLLDYVPLPNYPENPQGFQNSNPTAGILTKERYNAYTLKGDQYLSDTLRFSMSYVRNRRWQTGPYYGWPIPVRGPNNFQRFNQGSNAQLTATVSPTMVVTTRFGFTQHDFANFANGGGFDPSALGFPSSLIAQAPGQFFPAISMTNYTAYGGAGNNHDTSTNWYLTSSANKSLNKHSVKFGGEFRVNFDNTPTYSFASFAFTNAFTQRDALNADAASGNAFASFLLGYVASGSAVFNPNPAWGDHYYGFFLQDDWRIARNLTINLGVRWDYESPQTERYNRQNIGFDPTSPSTLVVPGLPLKGGLIFASSSDRLANKRDLNNFQPRVGVAWHFARNTVLRGGFGMSYIPTFAPGGTQGFTGSTPIAGSTDGGLTPVTHLSNPFPDGLLRPTGSAQGLATFAGQAITYVDPNRVIPYILQYSFGLQHELPANVLVDVSYVGSQTHQLGVSKNIDDLTTDQLALGTAALNQLVPNPFAGLLPGLALNSATTSRRNLIRPYPQFTSVTVTQDPIGRAWYNSLQVQVQKRLSYGLHIQMNFTWACTMQAASYLNNQFSDNQLERVRTQEDLPFHMDILAGYAIPFFKNSKGIKRAILGGWQTQLIALFQSGRQLPGVAGAYPTGVNPVISNPKAPDQFYFNACTVTTTGVRQNCASADQAVAWIQQPTDTLRVTSTQWPQIREMRPGVMDSSVFKAFYLKEKVQLQFRLEAFNTFNTPWFGQAQTGLTNARFGLLGNTQTNDPRNTQAALKLSF